MGLLASWEDFENGGLYTQYRRYPFFKSRAKHLSDTYQGTFLIVGCGWGYLVDELMLLGRDAWGVDASDYAIRSGHRELRHIQDRIVLGDARRRKDLEAVGPGHFDNAVSEDLLPVMDNPGEMLRIHQAMRRVATQVIHIVSYEEPDHKQDSRVRWHTSKWWGEQFGDATILGANDEVIRPGKGWRNG